MRYSKIVYIVFLILLFPGTVFGVAPEDAFNTISSTKHNLSITGSGDIKSTSTTQICVFCHTPHNSLPKTPNWNKNDIGNTYSPYQSSSMVNTVGQPDGPSRLCLSCHDGTIAIGELRNLPGMATSGSLQMTDSATGKLTGDGKLAPNSTGFTSYIGLNLQNDHPVSFQYTDEVAAADGELADPTVWESEFDSANPNRTPLRAGKLQCTSCHDAHGVGYEKFLKASLTQVREMNDPMHTDANKIFEGDILCVYCHIKKSSAGASFNWVGSSHQNSTIADEDYKGGNYLGLTGKVWQNSCLACHDTHTVVGGRRLLREGVKDDNPGANAVGRLPRQGSVDAADIASEETCYLCHTSTAESVLSDTATPPKVKNIEAEFQKMYHMPITTSDQQGVTEVHDVVDADLVEIGVDEYGTIKQYVPNLAGDTGSGSRRHVECTDCHNPHRMNNNSLYSGLGIASQGTHTHVFDGPMHDNRASGVLRGTWGIDPLWGTMTWDDWPTTEIELSNIDYDVYAPNRGPQEVTKEYHVCLKCHSSFAFGVSPPVPGDTGGNTSTIDSTKNNVELYTDQAKEFNPNNGSFHPVTTNTNRSLAERNITPALSPFLAPFKGPLAGMWVGDQTMYCSDCHGANIPAEGTSSQAVNTNPVWGPHGSTNEYLLIGVWDYFTGTPDRLPGGVNGDLCFKCHDYEVYGSEAGWAPGPGNEAERTGFRGQTSGGLGVPTQWAINLHTFHMSGDFGNSGESDFFEQNNDPATIDPNGRYYITCMTCHDGISHGVKGPNLLAAVKGAIGPCIPNYALTDDVSRCIDTAGSDQIPYRTPRTRLRIEDRDATDGGVGWGTSGNWAANNCRVAHEVDFEIGTSNKMPFDNGTTLRGCVQGGTQNQ